MRAEISPADHRPLLITQLDFAEAYLAAGKDAEAAQLARSAGQRLRTGKYADPLDAARAAFIEARALAPDKAVEARTLAVEAAAIYATDPGRRTDERQAVDTWLAAR